MRVYGFKRLGMYVRAAAMGYSMGSERGGAKQKAYYGRGRFKEKNPELFRAIFASSYSLFFGRRK